MFNFAKSFSPANMALAPECFKQEEASLSLKSGKRGTAMAPSVTIAKYEIAHWGELVLKIATLSSGFMPSECNKVFIDSTFSLSSL